MNERLAHEAGGEGRERGGVDVWSLKESIHSCNDLSMSNWLTFDSFTAPNPDPSKDPLRLGLSPELTALTGGVRRTTPVLQAWCHLMRCLPPLPNIGRVEQANPPVSLTTLHDAIACFGGLKRPHDNEKDGNSVLIYVINPRVSLEYSPDLVCIARPVTVPSNSVLTVQVRPNFPLQPGNDDIDGLVTRLEFVFNSERDARLPRKFDSRYGTTCWVRDK